MIRKLAIALAMLVYVGVTAEASACSCESRTADQQVAQADVIFIGTATGKTGPDSKGATMVTAFKVTEMLKGEPSQTLSVQHLKDLGGNCGVTFSISSKPVLVIAHKKSGMLRTGYCSLPGAPEADIRTALKKAKPVP